MRYQQTDKNLNACLSDMNKKANHKFGYAELFMLLMLFAAGFYTDYWFNHYQPPNQPLDIHVRLVL